MITDEKRAFKRVKRKFTIRYRPHGEESSAGGAAVSENISLGGVYFISLEKLEIGQVIDCWIKIPGVKDEGRWRARVVRCEDMKDRMVDTYGIAVEFISNFNGAEKYLKKALIKNS